MASVAGPLHIRPEQPGSPGAVANKITTRLARLIAATREVDELVELLDEHVDLPDAVRGPAASVRNHVDLARGDLELARDRALFAYAMCVQAAGTSTPRGGAA